MKIIQKVRVVEKELKVEKPSLAIDTKSKFVYSGGADVMSTWKRLGFIPPSEVREDYLFSKNREHK